MRETFIVLETAKLAAEKGFDWPCEYAIDEDNGRDCYISFGMELKYTLADMETSKENGYPMYLLPTQSLLQKWLREKHLLFVYITPKWQGSDKSNAVWRHNNSPESAQILYNTYEEALEAGLLDALTYIKDNN